MFMISSKDNVVSIFNLIRPFLSLFMDMSLIYFSELLLQQ
jgi:hypothetical protein